MQKKRHAARTTGLQLLGESKVKKPTEKQLGYIDTLRRELGIESDSAPQTSREASRVIDALKLRSAAAEVRTAEALAVGS